MKCTEAAGQATLSNQITLGGCGDFGRYVAEFEHEYALASSTTCIVISYGNRPSRSCHRMGLDTVHACSTKTKLYYPEAQTFISAWGGVRGMHSSQESYPETSKHFERIMKVSDALTADSDQGDFSFFKKNSDGSWHTALNVGGEWNKHPWNVLTSEQIQEMKSRLDIYLLSVTQFGQPHRTWKTIPIGLKCSLIPIAFAPSVGSLLCLEPESDLLFVVANNNDGVDVGTFNYCSSASDRLIVYATNTRFQSVLDFGACNDKNTLDEDRAISIQYIGSLIDSAGIGTRIVQTKNEPPLWKQLRYSDVVGGGLLILLILYALARTIKRATQNASRDITFQGLDSAVTETKEHRPRIE